MTDEELLTAATAVRQNAYVPFSDFRVGAALLDSEGRVFVGCNVENLSFGLTMCAERVGVGSAIASGSDNFTKLAIVSDSPEPVVPCGACRQVLAEFSPSLAIVSATLFGARAEFSLSELLPKPTQGIVPRST